MEKTTLYLPSELQMSLRETSRCTGRAQADIVREALAQYLEKQHRPLPRSIGIMEDSDLRGATVKDWIRENWHPDGSGEGG